MAPRIPKYRLHKSTGQALVQIAGKRIYLGKHNSEESLQRYQELLAQYLLVGGESQDPAPPLKSPITIGELILRYYRFARRHYVRNGKPTDEVAAIRTALRRLRQPYGKLSVESFGPKKLKMLREAMIAEDLSRKYINDSISRIKRMFCWAVSEELIEVKIYQALLTVGGLRQGQSLAKPSRRVTTVSEEHVNAVIAVVSEIVGAMIQVQLLTGVRPQEICNMRVGELHRSGEVWEYIPSQHKTEHFGVQRKIAIGPKAQQILTPLLVKKSDETYVFRPKDTVRLVNESRRQERKTPAYPSHMNRPKARRVRHPPGDHYRECSYAQAIRRACKRSGVPHWAPNQLRHTCGTIVRQKYGAEAAAAVLGNSLGMVVEVYAESNFELAKKVMKEIG